MPNTSTGVRMSEEKGQGPPAHAEAAGGFVVFCERTFASRDKCATWYHSGDSESSRRHNPQTAEGSLDGTCGRHGGL